MTNTSVLVRAATQEEHEAIMELAPRLTQGVAPWRDPTAVLSAAKGWLAASLAAATAHETTQVFVATHQGAVVAVVSVEEQRHFTGAMDAYVGELAVAAGAARQGVGRLLMSTVESWARDRGLGRVTLQTGAANTTAQSFYRELGYAVEDVRLTRPLPS
ncbi:GNAT family N-acetyltransferase [Streptomyces sp. YC504]|uniref:GNAT family N-acetyltransferase n=1 Tax=Streptomyces mesophilus TaxID=1775132 RepID=A0A6G4XTS3_9ACTN|nr:GNAT family N-acetyltransferase [Streptomyces mesophilus]NGO80986.1 GNAT family N-acetyltransferase [Streptomyces mesophilus]